MGKDLKFRIILQNLLKGGLDTAARQIRGFAAAAEGVRTRVAAAFTGIRLSVAGVLGVLGAVAVAARAAGAAIAKSFEMERYRTQFAVLLGSVDAAKQRLAELVKFAAETPFNMPEIAEASKQLEVLTGGVLGGAESLRLVGDAAAVAGRPLSEVAMWVGRAYDAIRNGRPFGEAAMRLSEMGILSGVARGKIEDLQAAGANVASVWQVLRDELARSSGAMVNLSQNGEGLLSTMKDTWDGALRQVGDRFQDLAKDKIKSVIDWIEYLQETQLDDWADGVMRALDRAGVVVGWIADKFGKLNDIGRGAGNFVGTLIGGGTMDQASQAWTEGLGTRERARAARDARKAERDAQRAAGGGDAATKQQQREAADLAAGEAVRKKDVATTAPALANDTPLAPIFRAPRDQSTGSRLGDVRRAIQSGAFPGGARLAMSESAQRFRSKLNQSALPGSVGLSSKVEIASKQEFLQAQTLKAIQESTGVLRKGLLGD